MSRVGATWGRMPRASRVLALVPPILLVTALVGGAFAVMGSGRPAPPDVAVVSPTASATPSALPPEPSIDPSATPLPVPSATPMPRGADPLLGTDGRLTVLLLGSDYRPAHPGNRTDAIIVVSIEPVSRRAASFSIPRDTIRFPLGAGRSYAPKVNGLYQTLQQTTGHGGKAMKAIVGRAYDIEVDWYAFIGFEGFKRLIGAVGGVDVTLKEPYYDPYYWVDRRTQGWGLPAGTSHLDADEALIFARSRKGDNDFGRARRQQQLVLAAVSKVSKLGVDRLPRLLSIARDTVRTDLPLAAAPLLFDIVSRTDISRAHRVVFGPRMYTYELGGSSFSPDLAACRKWIRANFPKARPMGHWPVAADQGSPSPSA